MKRLRRIIFNAVTVLSLALCVATCVLWTRSYRLADTWHWSRRDDGTDTKGRVGWVDVTTCHGRLGALVETNSAYLDDYPFGLRHEVEPAATAVPIEVGGPSGSGLLSHDGQPPFYHVYFDFAGFAYYRDDLNSHYHEHHWIVPLGSIAVLTAAAPALNLCSVMRERRKPRTTGSCFRCGYDLRATPDRCPECGTIAAKVKA